MSLVDNTFRPAVVEGIVTIEIPTIRIANNTVKYMKVVSVDNRVNNNDVTTTIDNPVINNHLAPIASKIFPLIGDRNPINNAPGKIIKPDSNGVKPAINCMYNGKIVSAEINIINAIIPIMTVKVYILFLKIRNSNIGSFNFNCRTINNVSVIDPIINETMTFKLVHPKFPTTLKPYNSPPKPNTDNTIDK